MPQLSKVIKSREIWREKAVERAEEIREFRKTQKRHKIKIKDLKEEQKEKDVVLEEKEKELEEKESELKKQEKELLSKKQELREKKELGKQVMKKSSINIKMLCVLLYIKGIVSYRSIPRILKVIKERYGVRKGYVPHFSSIINWSLRLGLGMLNRVGKIRRRWLAILDHSIEIGRKKLLIVLRVELRKLLILGNAIRLKDCECIGIKVSEVVNGEQVYLDLKEIFKKSGNPVAILKDNEASLNKGVKLWKERNRLSTEIIEDISHVIANGLKKQFGNDKRYKSFTKSVSDCSSSLRQTKLSFLIPPKLRVKGRFQSIGKLGAWGKKMLEVSGLRGRAKENSMLKKLRTALPGFSKYRGFIEEFSTTLNRSAEIMKLLKHKGLNKETYKRCKSLCDELGGGEVKECISNWLEKHLKVESKLKSSSLLISSDIIESLFGKYKYINERSPTSEINKKCLLIPTFCGEISEEMQGEILNETKHSEIKEWESKNINETLGKQRVEFFNASAAKKQEIIRGEM